MRLDGQPVTAAEVLAGALLGDFAGELLRGASVSRAAARLAAERGVETTAAELQAALDAWRTARDLIAADEFRAWMAAEELDLSRVSAWLDRRLLRDRVGASFRAELERRRPSLKELLPELHDEAVLAGLLQPLAEELALRLVSPPPAPETAESLRAARVGLLGLLGCAGLDEAAALLRPLGVPERRLAELVEAELAFRRLRSELGTAEALEQELSEHGAALVRFEVAAASFRSEDVAREVLCCVREDGDNLRRSAARAGESARSRVLLGEELDEEAFGHRLGAAAPKELFGPAEEGGRHHVAQLLRRLEPDLRSEKLREELRDQLVRRALRRHLAERVVFPVAGAA